jgi:hypothetical protein
VRRPSRAAVAVGLGVALVVAWYLVALELGSGPHFGASAATPYNRMADAFVHGRLDLGRAPARLASLPNPYDPVANARFRVAGLHDLSLHDGKLYAYWGPVPALLLYVPVHAVGGVLNDGWAVLLFCLASFGLAVATLLVVLRRLEIVPPPWALFFAVLGLGVANLAAHLLSRPAEYEVAIAAATCFVLASVLLFLLARLDRPEPRRLVLAAGGACAGLAAGSRPTTGLVVLFGVALLALRTRRLDEPGRRRASLAAFALGPFAIVVALLLAYNAARFGTPLEFGRRWQLTVVDLDHHRALDPSVIAPSLWNFIVPPPLLRAQFPFLFGNPGVTYPLDLPRNYIAGDAVIGVACLAPITLVLLAAPWVARGRSALGEHVGLLAGLGAVLIVPLLVLYGAPAAVRYEADFLPAWTLAALLAWLAWRARRPLRWTAVVGALALIWSVVALGASSLDNDEVLSELHAGTFRRLERAFSPLATGMAALAGHPIIAKVDGSAAGPPYRYDALGVAGTRTTLGRDTVAIRIVSPGDRTTRLRATLSAGGPVTVRLRNATRRMRGPGRAGVTLRLRRGVNVVRLSAGGRVRAADLRLG